MPNLADHPFARACECGGKTALWLRSDSQVLIVVAELIVRVREQGARGALRVIVPGPHMPGAGCDMTTTNIAGAAARAG